MNIDIRKSIKENFKNSSELDIKEAINSSITDGDEITLPGLGVFFEILWNDSDDERKKDIINIIKKSL